MFDRNHDGMSVQINEEDLWKNPPEHIKELIRQGKEIPLKDPWIRKMTRAEKKYQRQQTQD